MDLYRLFLYLFLGSVAGLAGGVALLWKETIIKNFSIHLISFAAGVMLATAFLDLLPEALAHGGEEVFLITLAGLVIFFLIEDFFLHFHHHEGHAHSLNTVIPLLMTSDSIHNLIDGMVITVSFLADPKLGLVVAIATFFHEVPQEIGDFAVLISAGISKTKALLFNLFSALTTFVGALLVLLFAAKSSVLMGPLLSLATGMFLYIASADILPELVKGENQKTKWQTAGFFLLGIFLVVIMTKIIPA